MAESILRVEGLSKSYGGLKANTDINLSLTQGEVHAVIGPNGAGKTTLINQIAGEFPPTSGRIMLHGRDVTELPAYVRASMGLARSFQITSIFPSFSVLDNVAFAVQASTGHGFRFWKVARNYDEINTKAIEALQLVGLGDRLDSLAGAMSHGEHRQLEVAMGVATDPQVMLLDEPTAGMGREESMAFVALLKNIRQGRTFLLVEHDMDVVFALSDRITVLANGRVIASGTPDEIKSDPAVRDAYLGHGE